MRRKYMRAVVGMALVVSSVGLVALIASAFDESDAGAALPALPTPDPTFLAELEAHGFRFAVVPGDAPTMVSPEQAVTYVSAEYGADPANMTVYIGLLTELDRLLPSTGDTVPTPSVAISPAVDRLSFAVQITGMTLYRRGGEGLTSSEIASSPEDIHHELVVFVDAMTGAEIVATTFR